MSRNDSLLYTGASSSAQRRAQEKERRKSEKDIERVKLAPAADVVMAEIAREKAMLGALLLDIIDPDTPDEQVSRKLDAVRLHREWLIRFESSIKKVLRSKADVKETWGE